MDVPSLQLEANNFSIFLRQKHKQQNPLLENFFSRESLPSVPAEEGIGDGRWICIAIFYCQSLHCHIHKRILFIMGYGHVAVIRRDLLTLEKRSDGQGDVTTGQKNELII